MQSRSPHSVQLRVRAVNLDSLEASPAAQSPQNFAVAAFSYPHFAQRFLKGAAHSLQNFCPAGFLLHT